MFVSCGGGRERRRERQRTDRKNTLIDCGRHVPGPGVRGTKTDANGNKRSAKGHIVWVVVLLACCRFVVGKKKRTKKH